MELVLASLDYTDALAVAIHATEQVLATHDEAFDNPYPQAALEAARAAVADPSEEKRKAAAACAEEVFEHWALFGPSAAFEAGDAAAFTALAAASPNDYQDQVGNAVQAATNAFILNLDIEADWEEQKAVFLSMLASFMAERMQRTL